MADAGEGRWLGLVGGLGPAATIHYYRSLTEAHAARGAPARLFIANADVQHVLASAGAGDIDGLADYLAGLTGALARAGAQVGAISAVTPHLCMPRLAEISELKLVDLITETVRHLHDKNLRRVALFGTRVSMQTALFGRLGEIEAVRQTPEEIERIHAAYVGIVGSGAGSPEIRDELSAIAHALIAREGAEAIVLAGTELALVFDEATAGFPAVDCARLHVEAIMRALFDEASAA